jgi:hypothetical protein
MTNDMIISSSHIHLGRMASALVLYYNFVVVIVVLLCVSACVCARRCMHVCKCDLLNSSFTDGRLLLSN